MSGMQIEVRLQGAIKWDEQVGIFVSYAPALGIYSQGKTEERAKKALESALELYLSVAIKEGILEKTLKREGFKLVPPAETRAGSAVENSIIVRKLKEEKYTDFFDVPVGLSLAAA